MPRSGTEDVSKLLNEFVERLEGTWDPGQSVSEALNCCIPQLEPYMADGRVSFVTIHYRNPALEEGRLSRLAVGKTARERTIASLGEILEDSSNITNLVSSFHDRLLDVYFGLIGRSDSFSDAALRAFAERPPRASGDEADDRSRVYSFAFLREAALLPLTCEASNGKFCIGVSKELQFRLLGWDGRPSIDQAKPSDCQLLHPLYRIVWDSVINQQMEANDDKQSPQDKLQAILRSARDKLEPECFFASREAFISGEAARLLRDEAARDQVTRIYDQLFPTAVADDLPQQSKKHGTELAKVERVLAVIQAAAIYAPVANDTFTLFARRMPPDYPSASGLVIGSAIDVVQDGQALTSQFIDILEDIVRYTKPEDLKRKPLDDSIEWIKLILDRLRTPLGKSGLNLEIFECLAYCADGLLGKKHEGENLSFRLALGTDEGLRQYLSPIFGKSGLGDNKDRNFFRVPLPRKPTRKGLQQLTNSLDRLIAVIQGNYSFAQDDSLYLCMAYGQQAIQVRYLAQLNPRVQRAGGATLSRTVSRIERIKSLSRIMPPLILAFLDGNGAGYIALGGEVQGVGRKGEKWRDHSSDGWFRPNLERAQLGPGQCGIMARLQQIQCTSNDLPFYNTLCDVIELIADTPGKGAIFVLGHFNGPEDVQLQRLGVGMTPPFEMVEKWQLESIDKDILYQAAIQDGATVIAVKNDAGDGGLEQLHCRIQLSAFDIKNKVPFDPNRWCPVGSEKSLITLWEQKDGDYEWPQWGRWFKWGTRHKTAAGVAYLREGKYRVICISSDGDVRLFDGHKVWDLSRNALMITLPRR